MNSLAAKLAQAGLVSGDQAAVAEERKQDIKRVRAELQFLERQRKLSPVQSERYTALRHQLQTLENTSVL